MSDFTIREYTPLDMPAMSLLWQKTFGDSEELVSAFHNELSNIGTAAVAECDGELVGVFYVIVGMELITPESLAKPICAYLYALAVDERYRGRGIGRALTLKASELAKGRGASVVCTLPAEASLYAWYKDILGTASVLRRRRYETPCRGSEPSMELSSTEYMLWRENMLRSQTHIHPSDPTLEVFRRFCKALGGGLYACGSGICAAYSENGVAVIRELITNDPFDCENIASSVGAMLGAKKAVYCLPSSTGEDYLAVLSGTLPADCIWNISFD